MASPRFDEQVPSAYGERQDIISNPKHERFYGKRNDRMPAFGEEKILDAQAIGLIADSLRSAHVGKTTLLAKPY